MIVVDVGDKKLKILSMSFACRAFSVVCSSALAGFLFLFGQLLPKIKSRGRSGRGAGLGVCLSISSQNKVLAGGGRWQPQCWDAWLHLWALVELWEVSLEALSI